MCSSRSGMTLVGSSGGSMFAGCVKLELLQRSNRKTTITATTFSKVATSTGTAVTSFWWQQMSWRVTTMEGRCNITAPSPAAQARLGRFIFSVAMPISSAAGGQVLGGWNRPVVTIRVLDSAKNLVSHAVVAWDHTQSLVMLYVSVNCHMQRLQHECGSSYTH